MQRGATKIIKGLEKFLYEERFQSLVLLCLDKKVTKVRHGMVKVCKENIFPVPDGFHPVNLKTGRLMTIKGSRASCAI